jgi:hypothetical protein
MSYLDNTCISGWSTIFYSYLCSILLVSFKMRPVYCPLYIICFCFLVCDFSNQQLLVHEQKNKKACVRMNKQYVMKYVYSDCSYTGNRFEC